MALLDPDDKNLVGMTDEELSARAKDLPLHEQFSYMNRCRQYRELSREDAIKLLQQLDGLYTGTRLFIDKLPA